MLQVFLLCQELHQPLLPQQSNHLLELTKSIRPTGCVLVSEDPFVLKASHLYFRNALGHSLPRFVEHPATHFADAPFQTSAAVIWINMERLDLVLHTKSTITRDLLSPLHLLQQCLIAILFCVNHLPLSGSDAAQLLLSR